MDKVETSLEWQEQFEMTGVFLLVPRYDWCASLSHPSSCVLVNHGPSEQSSVEEYKPWKWGATARYDASRTKTMLPTRKSVPRSSRQSDHTKTSWPSKRDANCSGMILSPTHQVWPNHLARHSERGKKTRQTEEEVGGQHQGIDRPWLRQVPEGSGEQGQLERKLVVKSSVVPQRPSRLPDRWWRWLWFQLNLSLCSLACRFSGHIILKLLLTHMADVAFC